MGEGGGQGFDKPRKAIWPCCTTADDDCLVQE